MMKRCTQSACRRTFNTKLSNGVCPHCGHIYPRSAARRIFWVNGRRYDVTSIFAPELAGKTLMKIKLLRQIIPGLGLRDARDLILINGQDANIQPPTVTHFLWFFPELGKRFDVSPIFSRRIAGNADAQIRTLCSIVHGISRESARRHILDIAEHPELSRKRRARLDVRRLRAEKTP